MSNGHHRPQTETTASDNNTYRPRSPDLSAYGLPPHQNHHPQHFHSGVHESSRAPPWQQRQGSSAALTGLPSAASTSGAAYPLATHRGSYDASPYFSPQGSFSLSAAEAGQRTCGAQQVSPHALPRRETLAYASATAESGAGEYSPRLTYSPTTTTATERYSPGKGVLPQSHGQGQGPGPSDGLGRGQIQPAFAQFAASAPAQPRAIGFHSWPSSTVQPQPQPQPQPQHDMPPSRRKRGPADGHDGSADDVDYRPEPGTGAAGGGGGAGAGPGARSSRKRKSDSDQAWTTGRAPGEVGPSLGIDIKTKFPVARIKRIMQADEDVGKVAQATPTAVSKALELFMITLVTKAAGEARDRSSKRVSAAHLKHAVTKYQTFDFLQEIIEKVPDAAEKKGGGGGGGGRAGSEDADDGGGGGGGGPAKKKRVPRGRKKAESDED